MPPSRPPFREFTVPTPAGVELRCYETDVRGSAVVILHGLAGSAREFFPTAEALPEFRAVLPALLRAGFA